MDQTLMKMNKQSHIPKRLEKIKKGTKKIITLKYAMGS